LEVVDDERVGVVRANAGTSDANEEAYAECTRVRIAVPRDDVAVFAADEHRRIEEGTFNAFLKSER